MRRIHVIAVPRQNHELLCTVIENFPDVRAIRLDKDGTVEPHEGELVCVVDWMAPDATALELCRRVRKVNGPGCKVVLILDEDSDAARREAIHAGADDYVVRANTSRGVIDRLRGYLGARNGSAGLGLLRKSGYALNFTARQIHWNGRLLTLQPSEFLLLAGLLSNSNKLLNLREIIGVAGRDTGPVQERTVHVWMGRLRRRLEAQGVPPQVRVVRGLGYVFEL